jgi:hypothetical protein
LENHYCEILRLVERNDERTRKNKGQTRIYDNTKPATVTYTLIINIHCSWKKEKYTMSETKAKIDIKAGTIELEGSEAFVIKYIDEFKKLITFMPAKESKKQSGQLSISEERNRPKKPKKHLGKKANVPKVKPEKYDIYGNNDRPSLEKFFDEKKPGRANGDRIAVIGYYITEIIGKSYFTEGQVEYSYKMLNIDRPKHLHQIMINNKNKKDYYEETEGEQPGSWVMTRTGEIFVSDKLPKETE